MLRFARFVFGGLTSAMLLVACGRDGGSTDPAQPPSLIERLSRIDADAQRIVVGKEPLTEAVNTAATSAPDAVASNSGNADTGVENGAAVVSQPTFLQAWPGVRSDLVGRKADRNDLLAADGAVRSFTAAVRAGGDDRRAANGITAAIAPLYAAAGDSVPTDVHRLGYLHRSLAIDTDEKNWARANADVVSLRTAWRRAHKQLGDKHGDDAKTYGSSLDAIQDALASGNYARMPIAQQRAQSALEQLERHLSSTTPAWQRYFHANQ